MGRKIYLGIIYSITLICILFGSCFHIFNFVENSFFNKFFENLSISGSQTEMSGQLNAFSNIDLDMSIMSVTILKGDTYEISYNCPEKYVPEYHVTNDTLVVTQPNDLSWASGGTKKCNMTITVPDTVLSNVTAQLDVGDMVIQDLSFKNLDITADVGDIEITNTYSEVFHLQADVGDVSLTDVNTENCTIEASVGDVDLDQCDFKFLDIRADTGDVDVSDITLALENYHINLETDLGEVTVNDVDHKRKYSSVASANTQSDYKLTIYVSTGDVEISD